MPRAEVIALFGPTGVGKTEVALELGDRLRELGEQPIAISADALQVYAGLQRLTGAATAAQQARLEHRMIGVLPVETSFSAGRYAQLAHAEIDGALRDGRRPIVVGGTGLYLRAALSELTLRPPPDPESRARIGTRMRELGPAALHAELAGLAPWAAAEIAPGDRQRIARALELYEMGQLQPRTGASELWTDTTRHPTLLAGLVMERTALYARIDARVAAMVAAGAADEVRAAAPSASATARRALGFHELLAGDLEAMQRHTRNYARRQLTWMRKLPNVTLIDLGEHTVGEAADALIACWQRGDRGSIAGPGLRTPP